MSKFSKGDRVVNSNTGEKGFVVEVYPPRRGRQLYKVKYDDRENDENSNALLPDVDLTDPFERCVQNYYNYYSDYLKDNTTFKIRSSNNSTISSLKASRTLFRAYQFKPLLKFLNSDNRRILIADEVGLGKTIEAGHIMLELKARGELRNALVVCPVSLRRKWTTELNEKFGLNFIEIEKKSDLLHELQHHNGKVRAVINYEKVRENSDILAFVEEKNIKFSIVVCDESHKLRNGLTSLYNGSKRLLGNSDSVVFMSATPIMIDENNLYNQLRLLDENQYDNYEVFKNNIQLNHPFIKALSQLNRGAALNGIAAELADSSVVTVNRINDVDRSIEVKVSEYFREYPIYQKIMAGLTSGEDTPAVRASIQYNLSEMSPMNSIFSRTRKREVTKDWSQAERNPHTESVSMTAEERSAYESYIEEYTGKEMYDEFGRERGGSFGLISVKRQLASSVWGFLNDMRMLDEGYDEFSSYEDSKFNVLKKILSTVFTHGNRKIIIFSTFKKTLKYLKIRLEKSGYKCAIMYGGSGIDKNEVLRQFQYDDSVQVLLSSEVGSEGLDMQFCSSMVNYDLPWNPMVVEQRIGRIDRFGQKSEKVNIYNIIVRESILENIYSRLLTRIGIFRESIGDLESILDSEMEQDGKMVTIRKAVENIGKDFYSDKLTPEEVEKKKAEIERAVENEKINLKKIEEGLTNALTNDSYFREEINKIEKNNLYVTSFELQQLVAQLIKERLTTCTLKPTDNRDVFKIVLSKSDPKIMRKFLQQYEPVDYESQSLSRQYQADIEDQLELDITFNQEYAFNNKSISFMNIYHPIVRAGVAYFEEHKERARCTFFFELSSKSLPAEIRKSRYMLAIYKISVSRLMFNKPHVTDSLFPILYDVDECRIVDNQDVAEQFMGCAQVDGRYASPSDATRLDKEMIEDLRYDMKDYVDSYVNNLRLDLQDRIENSRKMRAQQTMQYYNSRIKNLQETISTHEYNLEIAMIAGDSDREKRERSVLPLMRSNLNDMQKRADAELEKINNDVKLKVTEEIKSLNLVQVV